LRISRTNAVVEALVPAILEQKVTGEEAHRSFRRLVRTYGETPPGPPAEIAALRLAMPPRSEVLALIPYHALHPLGLERRRADVIRTAASHARRLEELIDHPLDAAYRRLRAIPGAGASRRSEAVAEHDFATPPLAVWPVTLEGDIVRLEPLSPDHLAPLAAVGLDERLWRWIPWPIRTGEDLAAYVQTALDGLAART